MPRAALNAPRPVESLDLDRYRRKYAEDGDVLRLVNYAESLRETLARRPACCERAIAVANAAAEYERAVRDNRQLGGDGLLDESAGRAWGRLEKALLGWEGER